MWMMPAWMKMGIMKRHHWFGAGFSLMFPLGCGLGTPPRPQSSLSVQVTSGPVVEVASGQGQEMGMEEFWTPGMLCMQGW